MTLEFHPAVQQDFVLLEAGARDTSSVSTSGRVCAAESATLSA
jgi:hypothetical protein